MTLNEAAYDEKVHAFLTLSGTIQNSFSLDYRSRKVRKATIQDERTKEIYGWDGYSLHELVQSYKSRQFFSSPLQFTLEVGGRSIHFLDLTITLTDHYTYLTSFLPPSYSGITFHGSSLHPHTHKLAAFHAMIRRLTSLPLNTHNYHHEIRTIHTIAQLDHIELDIKRLINRALLSRTPSQSTSDSHPHSGEESRLLQDDEGLVSSRFNLVVFVPDGGKQVAANTDICE